MSTWSDRVSGGSGCLCILSALPLLGIPFPSRGWAFYYADKNIWMSQPTKCHPTPKQAERATALLRVAVGLGYIYPPTRAAALVMNGAVVTRGTVAAYRDRRPMGPQWTMLGAIALCLVLEKL